MAVARVGTLQINTAFRLRSYSSCCSDCIIPRLPQQTSHLVACYTLVPSFIKSKIGSVDTQRRVVVRFWFNSSNFKVSIELQDSDSFSQVLSRATI
jgi:hypothetical protein